uniref:Fat storage-inducing transmembrane protein 2 n=1 Tax=Parastrongyloides trichosuri TaxID=131310 RepID=A0A0N4Z1S3_PARTI
MSSIKQTHQKKIPSGLKTTTEIILDFTSSFSRTILNIDSLYKAIFLFGMVLLVSIYGDFMKPDSIGYFSEKHNFLNQFIVKLGWLWTLSITVPFIFIISHGNNKGNVRAIFQDMVRLILATAGWYICTTYFIWHEKQTGSCKNGDSLVKATGRESCYALGGTWIHGFDISGHCFLMIYSSLILSEEAKMYKHWINDHTRDRKQITQVLFSLMGLLDCVWIFQLLITSLYYHTASHKFFGALFGLLCWFITHGRIHFIRIIKSINQFIDYNPRRVKNNRDKSRRSR